MANAFQSQNSEIPKAARVIANCPIHLRHNSTCLVDLQYDTYSELGTLVMSKLFLASVVHYPILHLERDAQVHS